MEINSRNHMDQTDPFAHPKHLARQVKQWQAEIKHLQQVIPPEVFDQVMQGVLMAQTSERNYRDEPAVHFTTVEVPRWDGESMAQASQPSVIYRPRRIARHIPWQWRMRVAVIRLTRMMGRMVQRQLRQFRKFNRQLRHHRR